MLHFEVHTEALALGKLHHGALHNYHNKRRQQQGLRNHQHQHICQHLCLQSLVLTFESLEYQQRNLTRIPSSKYSNVMLHLT